MNIDLDPAYWKGLIRELPVGCLGQVSPPSGLVQMRTNKPDWERARNSWNKQRPTPIDVRLLGTYAHETYHIRQIALSGFLYTYAANVWTLILGLLGGRFTVAAALEATQRELLPNTIVDGFRSVTSKLVAPNEEGLSPLHIVEGAALLYERRALFGDWSNDDHMSLLDKCAGHSGTDDVYGAAYRHLQCSLDNRRAHEAFLPICFAALCFWRPHDAFLHIARYLRQRDYEFGNQTADIYWLYGECVSELAESLSYLGTGSEVDELIHRDIVMMPEVASRLRPHPVYRRILRDIAVEAEHDFGKSVMTACDPRAAFPVRVPVLFSDYNLSIYPADGMGEDRRALFTGSFICEGVYRRVDEVIHPDVPTIPFDPELCAYDLVKLDSDETLKRMGITQQ